MLRKIILFSICLGSVVCHGQAQPKKQQKKPLQQTPYSVLKRVGRIDNTLRDPNRLTRWANTARNALQPLINTPVVEEKDSLFLFISYVASVIKEAGNKEELKLIVHNTGLSKVLQDAVRHTLWKKYAHLKSIMNIFGNLQAIIYDFDPNLVKEWDHVYKRLLERTSPATIQPVTLARGAYLRSQVQQNLPIPWLEIWCKRARDLIGRFKPIELANSVYGLGRLELEKTTSEFDTFIAAWCDKARKQLDTFYSVELANSIYGLGKLNIEKTSAVRSFIEAWCVKAHEQLDNDSFTATELTNSIYGLGRLEIERTTPGFASCITAWLKRAREQLDNDNFVPVELANSVYGLGKLEIERTTTGFASFIAAWLKKAREQLDRNNFTSIQLANSIYGLGRLEVARTTSGFESFLKAWYTKAREQLENDNFTAIELSNSVFGLGKLEVEKTQAFTSFIKAWYTKACEHLERGNFTPLGLANSVHGLGKLEVKNSSAFTSFIEAWFKRAREHLNYDNFSHTELANSIYGIGKLGVKTYEARSFIDHWYEKAYEQLYTFGPKELVKSIYGLEKLDTTNSEEYEAFIERWYDVVKDGVQKGNFNAHELAVSVFALGGLNVSKSPAFWRFIQALCDQVRDIWGQCSLDDLSLLINGVANLRLSVNDGEKVQGLIAALLSTISQQPQARSQISSVHILYGLTLLHINHANDYARAQEIEAVANRFIDTVIVNSGIPKEDATQLAWSLYYFDSSRYHELMQYASNVGYDESVSDLERCVYNVVSSLHNNDEICESPQDSLEIPELLTSVDIGFPHHKVLVEVDGLTHFLGRSQERVPSDILKDRLLGKLGWSIVRIPYFEWNTLQTDEAKRAYLLDKLSHLRRDRSV